MKPLMRLMLVKRVGREMAPRVIMEMDSYLTHSQHHLQKMLASVNLSEWPFQVVGTYWLLSEDFEVLQERLGETFDEMRVMLEKRSV